MAREGEIQEFIGISASREIGWGERLTAVVAAQKERLFLFSPVCLGTGIALYFSLKGEPRWMEISIPLVLTIMALAYLWPRRLNHIVLYGASILMMAGFLCSSGMMAAKIRTAMVATPMLERSLGPATVEGRIASIEFLEDGEGVRLILQDIVIDSLAPEETPHSIRLKVRKGDNLQPGDRISVLAELNPPSAPVAPGAYDFQRFAFFRQIGAFGFSYKDPVVIKKAEDGVTLWLEHLRQYAGARILEAMPPDEAGIANALMTGERAAISEKNMEDMRNSGIVHIISISGLHITMIAGVVFFVVRFLMALFPTFALYHPIKKYSAVIALIVTILYMCMVGATVPTVRSVIMTGIVLLAVMLDRIPLSLRVVAIAALLILVFVPEAVVGPSFQMSFAAVAGLVAFYEATRTFWVGLYRNSGWFRRGLIYLAGVCITTVIASLATAPFSIYHFQQFANYGLLANLLAVPLTSFVVMPAILLAYALMPLGLEAPALWMVGQGISGMLWVSQTVASLPHAIWTPAVWPMGALLSFVLALFLLFLLQGWARVLSVAPLVAGVLFIMAMSPPDILVSASGKLVAVNQVSDGKVYVTTIRAEKFVSEAWMRQFGYGTEKPDRMPGPGMDCDDMGCRFLRDGRKIALSFHPAGHQDDCVWADILIAEDPVRAAPCAASIMIDRFDLWRDGAYAVWAAGMKVKSVGQMRGGRPWTVSNKR